MRSLVLALAGALAAIPFGALAPAPANAADVEIAPRVHHAPRVRHAPPVRLAPVRVVPRVAYRCPPVWTCGPVGCGWRSICGVRPYPNYGFYYRPRPYFGYYRPRPYLGYYRPYRRYRYRPAVAVRLGFGPRWRYW